MQIYADNAATTKMSEAAIKTMTDYMRLIVTGLRLNYYLFKKMHKGVVV